jgi:hypothetical protein
MPYVHREWRPVFVEGDAQHLFGLSVSAAERYATALDHPGFANLHKQTPTNR